jgi:iron complex transport system permease protein
VQARAMNALLMGDETAATLGINLHQFRRLLFVLVSLLTGILVAVSGSIGFIGLMIPHMVRFAVRSDHRRVLPLSLLIGAIFLIWVDVLARTLIQPAELPVGVITALIGGPFFLYLLWRSRNEKRGGME